MRVRLEKTVLAGDGTRLYARQTAASGARGLPMICANGIGVSTFFWKYIEEAFSASRPVIAWDYRGHGKSEFPRDLDDLTMEAMGDDLLRVLEAFGHERAILLGHSMGCQVIYGFALRYPQRTAMLVPMLGTYGRPVHTFLDRERISVLCFMLGHRLGTLLHGPLGRGQRAMLTSPTGRRLACKLARAGGLVHPARMPQRDLEDYLDHFAEFSPLVFFRMAEKMATHSVGRELERIAAPTLVVAGERDIFTPFYLSQEAAERIPQGRLLVLLRGSHAGLVEQPDLIRDAIDEMIAEQELDRSGEAAPAAEKAAG